MLTCKRHGYTESISNGVGKKRCKRCRSEAVARRRRKVKELLVEYKGGKCERCGYDKCIRALDFHHKDRDEKSFGLSSKGHTFSLSRGKTEVDKCELLCANCHRETHDVEVTR